MHQTQSTPQQRFVSEFLGGKDKDFLMKKGNGEYMKKWSSSFTSSFGGGGDRNFSSYRHVVSVYRRRSMLLATAGAVTVARLWYILC
ncbi:hypothetical protein EYC80_003470 [Monilinia laxa]|uniref:Uncharacterized protein n=1 Tax=Monilinia laxa TaxID=61186 RepID=A0A5N6KE40_MONLA|nr:hypothetical protein EYC80_003470 [Monilinia laxa]